MTKIESLTPEQKARFDEFRIKWTNIGLCTLPADRPTAEKGIELIYQAAGLKKPRIVWCGSPLTNALTRAFVKDILKGRRGGASVWASVGDSVGASVWDSVGASVWDSVGASGYGQHDANWLAFYDYFKEVCGLVEQTKNITGHWMIALSANWYLPHKNICWISERHNKLFINERGRLHCENGMALTYPDGWGIYALNGIQMKPEYVLTPASELSPQTVLKEQSVDIRRELLRKIGVLKMKSQGKIIETIGEYELIDMSPVFTGINYAPHLLMRNPSLPDTFHLEGVAPQCHTIEQAINWRAGNINIRWTPAMLS
jgi:hypothetical protein